MEPHRLLSQPMGVYWDGWQSDTLTLQNHGWALAIDYEPRRNQYILAMKHRAMQLHAITDALTIERRAGNYLMEPYALAHVPIFTVRAVAPSIQCVKFHGMDLSRFQPIDATPTYTEARIQRIEDYNCFRVVDRAQEITFDRADLTVVEHLDAIKRLQAPKQQEIRQRLLREQPATERRTPRLQVVASLVHYEEAA